MSPLFVTEYSPETIIPLIFTGLPGGICFLDLSLQIVLNS